MSNHDVKYDQGYRLRIMQGGSVNKRISKDEYYIRIAGEVAQRSTCLRHKYGAVIVNNDTIVATGYNGSARGVVNCCDNGICDRDLLQVQPGERVELCKAIHAELNACLHAGRDRCIGATMYLTGIDAKTGKNIDAEPCAMCRRIIKQCGIERVIHKQVAALGTVE